MEQANRDHEQIMEFGTTRDVVGKPLHRTIRDSVTISLEEDMNLQAIDLLTDMTTCGLSSYLPPGKRKPVNVPSPEIISILTTLTLHPKCTTRIDMDKASKIQWNASHKAIAYLRTLIRLAGATNCELQKAWKFGREEKGDTFEDETNTTRRMRNRDVAKGKAAARGRKGAVIVETNVPFAKLDYAHDENLFKRATDIWSLVGWAMVCSIAYKKRWELWKEFLDLVLETVQQDFNERIEASAKPEDIDLEGSLIYAMGFLPDMVGGAGYKRVVRAIFANGSEKSMNEFTPIFELETKGVAKGLGLRDFVQTVESNLYVTRAGQDEGFQGINDESAAYADFRNKLQNHGEDDGQDEESDDEDQEYLERRRHSKKKGDKANINSDQEALDQWGGMDAIVMRQKFMCLVSTAAAVYDHKMQKQKREEEALRLSQSKSKRKKKSDPTVDVPVAASQQPAEDPLPTLVINGINGCAIPPSVDEAATANSSTYSSKLPLATSASSLNTMHLTTPHKRKPSQDVVSPSKTPTVKRPKHFKMRNSGVHSPNTSQNDEDMYLEAEASLQPLKQKAPVNQEDHNRCIKPDSPPESPKSTLLTTFLSRQPLNILSKTCPPPNNLQMSWIFANDNETLNCFYEEYSDNVRSLPINQMLLFTSSTFYPEADPAFRATLIVRILQKSMVFQPKGGWKDDMVNDFVLQEYYLSHFARGTDVESQVRMSVLLELLTRLWHMNAPYGAGLTWSEEMEQSMEAGIKIRREKAEAAAKKKRGISESDKELLELLDIVEVQMRWLMGAAKLTEEKRRTNM